MDDVPLFPDSPAITVERTLALVKPDVIDHADQIVEEIKRKGFTVLQVSGFCLRKIWLAHKTTCTCKCTP